MKTLRLFLVTLVLFCVCHAAAQTYRVDTFRGDSLTVSELTIIGGKEAVGVHKFKIANGDTVTLTRPIENFPGYAAVKIDGKEYAVRTFQLCFFGNEGVEDPYNTLQIRWRTPDGRYFSTLTPYLYIVYLVGGALLLGLLAVSFRPLRFVAGLLVPLMIAAACYLEVSAWLALNSDMFWWCDKERFGFWGSVLRVIPFSFVLLGQLASYFVYKKLMISKDNDKTANTSIMPIGISILVAVPVIIIAVFVCALCHVGKPTQNIVGTVILAVIVGVGSLTSIVLNIKALGVIRGLWFTVFGAIYIVGAMIALIGFGIALWHLLLEVLITIVPWALLFLILTHSSSSSGASEETSSRAREIREKADKKKADEEATRRWNFMLFQTGKRDRY